MPGINSHRFDVDAQMRKFAAEGRIILACRTCLESRPIDGTELCPISTMADCVQMVEWADRVITF